MKARTISFQVVGKGTFPLDMLRYDTCYPSSPQAVDRISLTRDNCVAEEFERLRSVSMRMRAPEIPRFDLQLLCEEGRVPTAKRWESFGWRVEKVEILAP